MCVRRRHDTRRCGINFLTNPTSPELHTKRGWPRSLPIASLERSVGKGRRRANIGKVVHMLGWLRVSLEGLSRNKQQCQTKLPRHPGMTKAFLVASQPRRAVLSLDPAGRRRRSSYCLRLGREYPIIYGLANSECSSGTGSMRSPADDLPRPGRAERPRWSERLRYPTPNGRLSSNYRLEVSPAIPSLRYLEQTYIT